MNKQNNKQFLNIKQITKSHLYTGGGMTLIVLSLFLLSSNTSGVIAQTSPTQPNDGQTEQQTQRDWIVPGNELVDRINALATYVNTAPTESTTSLKSLVAKINNFMGSLTALIARVVVLENEPFLEQVSTLDCPWGIGINTEGDVFCAKIRKLCDYRGETLYSGQESEGRWIERTDEVISSSVARCNPESKYPDRTATSYTYRQYYKKWRCDAEGSVVTFRTGQAASYYSGGTPAC